MPTEVGRAFESIERLLLTAFVAFGVDDADEVSRRPLQLGRVEALRIVEQDLHATCPERAVDR